jgi:hypothetical protein
MRVAYFRGSIKVAQNVLDQIAQKEKIGFTRSVEKHSIRVLCGKIELIIHCGHQGDFPGTAITKITKILTQLK